MIAFLNNLTIRQRIIVLTVLSSLGFVVFGAWSFKTLRELQINGPLYQRIAQGKDLVADILPLPEYIIESYVVALEMVSEADMEQKMLLSQRLNKLQDKYNSKHDNWVNQSLQQDIADAFLNGAYPAANYFYKIAFDEFIPAIEKNNENQINAAIAGLREAYVKHAREISKVIPLITQKVKENEIDAEIETKHATILMIVIMLITVVVCVFMVMLVAQTILKSLGGEPKQVVSIIREIALGNLNSMINLDKKDDFSVLASVKAMQYQLQTIVDQIHHQVEYAVAGDFTRKIDLQGKQGFPREIGQSLNQLRIVTGKQIGRASCRERVCLYV